MANTEANKIIGSARGASGDPHEASIEEYWTEERRAAAKPVPTPKPSTPATEAHDLPKGEPGHTAGGPGAEKNPTPELSPHGTGGQPVPSPLNYPYRTCGKIYFNQGSGGFSGSASLIAPNVLLTAGHCVIENGKWSTNMVFYPSYPKRASSDPFYKFNYSYEACWTAWSQNGNSAYDYGMIWIDAGPGNSLGWLGTLWNAPGNLTCEAVGYPALPSPPFNGGAMDHCVGQIVGGSGSGTVGLNNDNMEQGSSGGPWITAWQEPTRTHAAGIQSFHTSPGATTEYGPYFTQDLNNLFNWISNPANR
jgi:V8-like Glu-specific endopeptidase